MDVVSWREFSRLAPALAQFTEERLGRAPDYLATVRPDGWPRVHPVGPLVPREGHLVVVMYPTSPKRHDLRRNGRFAVHAGVENEIGGNGEVLLTGEAVAVEPTEEEQKGGYVAFEMLIGEVVATRYDELGMNPSTERWSAGTM